MQAATKKDNSTLAETCTEMKTEIKKWRGDAIGLWHLPSRQKGITQFHATFF